MVDVANWYLKTHPTKAFGAGGRKGRTDVGDCWDHYVVTYWYPDVLIDFSCSQFCEGYADLVTRLYGTEGTVDAHYNGEVNILGRKSYKGGPTKGMYTNGAITNLKTFEQALRDDKPVNNSEESAISSLTTILGRMAAEKNAIVTWDEMMKDEFRYEVDLKL
jgi:myo-inositol 2-dehydrogenase/D-chiro-inositol 1-dehydrogenase